MQQPGAMVLRRVAAMFRENPGSWSQGFFGVLPGGVAIGEDPGYETIKRMTAMCIDIAIVKIGMPLGGTQVVDEARRMFCNRRGMPHTRKAIWEYNDADGRSIEQVITTLEDAAAYGDGSRSCGPEFESAQPAANPVTHAYVDDCAVKAVALALNVQM